MKEQALINGCKIEIQFEQLYHDSALREARTEDDKKNEQLRHEHALRNICDNYDKKIKEYRDLGALEK